MPDRFSGRTLHLALSRLSGVHELSLAARRSQDVRDIVIHRYHVLDEGFEQSDAWPNLEREQLDYGSQGQSRHLRQCSSNV